MAMVVMKRRKEGKARALPFAQFNQSLPDVASHLQFVAQCSSAAAQQV